MLDPFAMMFPMGTLEETKDKEWTWILGAPLSAVTKAGVEFDPDSRSTTAAQGDASSGSALGVSHLLTSTDLGKSTCLVPGHWFCNEGLCSMPVKGGSKGVPKLWLCCLNPGGYACSFSLSSLMSCI